MQVKATCKAINASCSLLRLLLATSALSTLSCDDTEPTESRNSDTFHWVQWAGCYPNTEHPRPDFFRQNCISLDGVWQFQLDPNNEGIKNNWQQSGSFDRNITVPFSWPSPASGIEIDTGDKGGIGWYKKTITMSNESLSELKRWHLVIGAADWKTTLFVNGKEITTHDNGYLPLRADISDALKLGENAIVIRVEDPGNNAEYPHGKQGWPWYKNVAGIWQSVYLEQAAPTSLERLALISQDDKTGHFVIQGEIQGPIDHCSLALFRKDTNAQFFESDISEKSFSNDTILNDISPWSPQSPNLIDIEAQLTCGNSKDTVRTYAAWRRVKRSKTPGQTFESVELNDRPIYVKGILVQGYNPEGIYTYRNHEMISNDLLAAKNAGYNLVRLHIKVEDPWVLYQADQLGLLVDADVPCGGVFPIKAGNTSDQKKRLLETMEGMFKRDAAHPSIIWWTLFNEDWGLMGGDGAYNEERQAFVKDTLSKARELDSTRLIEDHSTLRFDHVSGTDINSFHIYGSDPVAFENEIHTFTEGAYVGSTFNFVKGETQDGAPLINTEYGPFSYELLPEWKTDRDVSFGLRMLTNILRKNPPMVGYVFTELYDVEFEHNGLLDYDRTPKEHGYPQDITFADMNADDYVGFAEPYFQHNVGEPITVTPFLSRWGTVSDNTIEKLSLRLFDANDTPVSEAIEIEVIPLEYQNFLIDPVNIDVPMGLTGAAYVYAIWTNTQGVVLGKNYLPGELIAEPKTSPECTETSCTIAIDLSLCTGSIDDNSTVIVDDTMQSVGFLDTGSLSCPIEIPSELVNAASLNVSVEAEMASNIAGAPQTTKGRKGGSTSISFGEQRIDDIELVADQSDSRGILSHINGAVPAGGYGAIVRTKEKTIMGPVGANVAVTISATDANANGVMIYGARMGRFGKQPVVRLSVP